MTQQLENVLSEPQRLQRMHELGLLDATAEKAFDRLTRLASMIVDAPVSLVSIVDADRQFFKSMVGLPEPWASQQETPLSHSFCQYVVASGEPLIVEDARKNAMLKNNLAIPDLNVIGYLGMPLITSDGLALGSFCVIDGKPRKWTEREVEIVRELALSVMTEIELRSQINARTLAEEKLENQNRALRRVMAFCDSTLEHMEQSLHRGANPQELTSYVSTARAELNKLT